MAIRLDYLAKETGQNLFRNFLLTFSAILTISVSLLMVGAVILVGDAFDHAFEKWQNDVSFIVYVNVDAQPDQVDALRKDLETNPQVDTVSYLDRSATFDEFRRLFKDTPTMTETVRPEDLPTSFRVKPKNPDADVVKSLADTFRPRPGVYSVDFPSEEVRRIQRYIKFGQYFLWGAAGALLLASTLLVFTTIRIAVFARRREIEVMQLVGATNWFIRIPFVLEGLIEGLIGAAVASGFLWIGDAAIRYLRGERTDDSILSKLIWDPSQFRWAVLWVTLLAIGLGSISSFASVTWYLRDRSLKN